MKTIILEAGFFSKYCLKFIKDFGKLKHYFKQCKMKYNHNVSRILDEKHAL